MNKWYFVCYNSKGDAFCVVEEKEWPGFHLRHPDITYKKVPGVKPYVSSGYSEGKKLKYARIAANQLG